MVGAGGEHHEYVVVDSHDGQKSKVYLMGSTQLYTATKFPQSYN